MDLSLSPDVEAYVCYLVLLGMALIVAVIQVRTLLKGYTNVWSSARSWLLLGAYTSVPIALFWLLDRADALHDTSLFAAILVAITYRQILSGGSQGVTVPSGFAAAWQPFVTWSNNVASGIRDRIARNNSQYDAEAIRNLASNQEVFDEVRRIVLNGSPAPAQVQAALDAFDALKPPLDDSGVQARKARYLYIALKAVPEVDADKLLKDRGIIDTRQYYLYAKESRSKWFVRVVSFAVAVGAMVLALQLRDPVYQAGYYLWRLEKTNATVSDRFRAEQHLEQGLRHGDSGFIRTVRDRLKARLRYAALPLETGDRMLAVLFQGTGGQFDSSLIADLAESLRTENADLRSRTEKVLVYLADQRGLKLPAALREWKPGKEDALTCVDAAANAWKRIAEGGSAPDGALACLAEPAKNEQPQAPAPAPKR